MLLVGGIFQVVHAFSTPNWKGRMLSIFIGLLFVGSGVLLMLKPLSASLGLTIVFAVLFIAGGGLRLFLAYQLWQTRRLAAGAIRSYRHHHRRDHHTGRPWTGLVVPGLLFGIDVMFGACWLALGIAGSWRPSARDLTHRRRRSPRCRPTPF
jgi:uncharacterized membrane protein HdeD (DUF308 family)